MQVNVSFCQVSHLQYNRLIICHFVSSLSSFVSIGNVENLAETRSFDHFYCKEKTMFGHAHVGVRRKRIRGVGVLEYMCIASSGSNVTEQDHSRSVGK